MPRRGFTLLEVALVAVVIVMLAAMAYPSIESIYGGVRLTAAADQIRARWADARAHASNDGVTYRFSVVSETGRYRLAPDTDQYWAGATAHAGDDEADADSPPLVLEEELPKGVKFAEGQADANDVSGEWATLVRFRADGTADKDVEITFSSDGAPPLVLKLRGLTGAVSTQQLTAGK